MTLQELSLVHVRVSVAQAFGGENDQRESSCDHRAVSRWNFAGAGAERSRNGQRTAGSRRRCGQSHSRCAGVWSPGSSRDETPQKHLHVGKEPQRLKDEYHQIAISKCRFSSPGFEFQCVRGSFLYSPFFAKECGPLSPRSRQGLKALVTIQCRKVLLVPSRASDRGVWRPSY